MFAFREKFPGLRGTDWGAKARIMVASAPQKNAPKLSDSLMNNRLWVNNPFRTAARKQPSRTAPAFAGVLYGTPNRLWGVMRTA